MKIASQKAVFAKFPTLSKSTIHCYFQPCCQQKSVQHPHQLFHIISFLQKARALVSARDGGSSQLAQKATTFIWVAYFPMIICLFQLVCHIGVKRYFAFLDPFAKGDLVRYQKLCRFRNCFLPLYNVFIPFNRLHCIKSNQWTLKMIVISPCKDH